MPLGPTTSPTRKKTSTGRPDGCHPKAWDSTASLRFQCFSGLHKVVLKELLGVGLLLDSDLAHSS